MTRLSFLKSLLMPGLLWRVNEKPLTAKPIYTYDEWTNVDSILKRAVFVDGKYFGTQSVYERVYNFLDKNGNFHRIRFGNITYEFVPFYDKNKFEVKKFDNIKEAQTYANKALK